MLLCAGKGFGTWQLTGLTSLSLQNGSSLSDQGLAALTQLDSLRCLNLKGCRSLSDAGLASLPALSRLSRLRLQVRHELSGCAVRQCRGFMPGAVQPARSLQGPEAAA